MTIAKKSLGQNFLIDENIINKIATLIKIKDQTILEVGPGTGNLTKALLKKNPKKIYVIEKDDNLANLLKSINLKAVLLTDFAIVFSVNSPAITPGDRQLTEIFLFAKNLAKLCVKAIIPIFAAA